MPTARHIYAALDDDVVKYDSADLSTYVWREGAGFLDGGASIGANDSGRAWHANRSEQEVLRFERDGISYGAGSIRFTPTAVSADDSGNYYVAAKDGEVVKFDQNDDEEWSASLSGTVKSLMWHEGTLYASVANYGLHSVDQYGSTEVDEYTEPSVMASAGDYFYFGEYNSFYEDNRLKQQDASNLDYNSLTGGANWSKTFAGTNEFIAMTADDRGVYVSLEYDDMLVLDTGGTQKNNTSLAATPVHGLGGGDAYTFTDNQAPTASFAYSKSNGTVDFTDQSSDGDGTIQSWEWDFGDGTTSTSQNPTHSYATSGTYTVSLTVTDDGGATATATQDISVTVVIGGDVSVTDKGAATDSAGAIANTAAAGFADTPVSLSVSASPLASGSVSAVDKKSIIQASTLPGQRADSIYVVEDGALRRRSALGGAMQEELLDSVGPATVEAESSGGAFYVVSATDTLTKYDSNASELWSRTASTTLELGKDHIWHADGQDVVKATKDGVEEWRWTNPLTNISAVSAAEGEVYAVVEEYADGTYNTHLYKINGGAVGWSKTHTDAEFIGLEAMPGGDVALAVNDTLKKYSPTGTELWSRNQFFKSKRSGVSADPFGALYVGEHRSVEKIGPDGWFWDKASGNAMDATPAVDNGRHAYVIDHQYSSVFGLTQTGDTDWELKADVDVLSVPRPNIPPSAGFQPVTDGLQVAFVDNSSDVDGSISSYSWDLGDGTTSAEPDPSHTYNSAGTYTASLTVTDDEGATDTISLDVAVAPIVHASAAVEDQLTQLAAGGTPVASAGGSFADNSVETITAQGGPYVSAGASLTGGKPTYASAGQVLSQGLISATDAASAPAAVLASIASAAADITGGEEENVLAQGGPIASAAAQVKSKREALALVGRPIASATGLLTGKGEALAAGGEVSLDAALAHTNAFGNVNAFGDILATGGGSFADSQTKLTIVGDVFSGGRGALVFSDEQSAIDAAGGVLAIGGGGLLAGAQSAHAAGLALLSGTSSVEDHRHVLTLGGRVLASGQGGFANRPAALLLAGSALAVGESSLTLVDGPAALALSGGPIAGAAASLADNPHDTASRGEVLTASTLAVADDTRVPNGAGLARASGSLHYSNPPQYTEGTGVILTSGTLSTEGGAPIITIPTFVGRKPDSISIGVDSIITVDTGVHSSL